MKCNLNNAELEDMLNLFERLQKAQADIKIGLDAHENLAETVNEINCLTAEDSEYGAQLCRQGLEHIKQIQAAELALLEIDKCCEELLAKYGIPSSRSGDGKEGNENCA